MTQQNILTEEFQGIGHIILNRPSRHNAFDEHVIQALTQQITHYENDASIKVILLRANGKNFSAGADLEWMKKMIHFSLDANKKDALQLANMLQTLYQCKKPTIALANGITMGGGIGLFACCDIVLAEDNARFCFSEAKLGLVPATIAPYVINAIGIRQARYLFLTAKNFTVEEAKSMGLVHETTASENLYALGMEYANRLLKNGPQAMLTIKTLLHRFDTTNVELLNSTANLIAQIRTSPEAQEGLAAFFEQREPNWSA